MFEKNVKKIVLYIYKGKAYIHHLVDYKDGHMFFIDDVDSYVMCLNADEVNVISVSELYSDLLKPLKLLELTNGNEILKVKLSKNQDPYEIIDMIKLDNYNIISYELRKPNTIVNNKNKLSQEAKNKKEK